MFLIQSAYLITMKFRKLTLNFLFIFKLPICGQKHVRSLGAYGRPGSARRLDQDRRNPHRLERARLLSHMPLSTAGGQDDKVRPRLLLVLYSALLIAERQGLAQVPDM